MKETRGDINRAIGCALLLHGLLLALVFLGLWQSRDTLAGAASGSGIQADLSAASTLTAAMQRAVRTLTQPQPLQTRTFTPPPAAPENAPAEPQPPAQALIPAPELIEREHLEHVAEAEPTDERKQKETESQEIDPTERPGPQEVDHERRLSENLQQREPQPIDVRTQPTQELKQLDDGQTPHSVETLTEADGTSNTDSTRGNDGTDSDLLVRYHAALREAIARNWNRPEWVALGELCDLVISQMPGGAVVEVQVDPACPYDQLSRRSLEAAVLMAQPLPYLGFEEVFQPVMILTFEAQEE